MEIEYKKEELTRPRELTYKVDYFTGILKTKCRNREDWVPIGSLRCAECPYYKGIGKKPHSVLCSKRKLR